MSYIETRTLAVSNLVVDAPPDSARAEAIKTLLDRLQTCPVHPLVTPADDGTFRVLREGAAVQAVAAHQDTLTCQVLHADRRLAWALRLVDLGLGTSKAERVLAVAEMRGISDCPGASTEPLSLRQIATLMNATRTTLNEDLEPRARLYAQESAGADGQDLNTIARMTRTEVLRALGELDPDAEAERTARKASSRMRKSIADLEAAVGPETTAQQLLQDASDETIAALQARLNGRADGPAADAPAGPADAPEAAPRPALGAPDLGAVSGPNGPAPARTGPAAGGRVALDYAALDADCRAYGLSRPDIKATGHITPATVDTVFGKRPQPRRDTVAALAQAVQAAARAKGYTEPVFPSLGIGGDSAPGAASSD